MGDRGRNGSLKRKLWKDGQRQLLRTRDDEHLSEIVGVDSSQGGIEGGGKGRGTDTCSKVGIVASFDSDNTARCGEEGGIVGEKCSTSEVCADANGCDHVGEIDEGGGRIIWEFVDAWGDGSVAGGFEDGSDGVRMCLLML